MKNPRRFLAASLIVFICVRSGLSQAAEDLAGTPVSKPKPSAEASTPIRIVTLGDSITKGVRTGVLADQTFSAIVEAELKQRQWPVEVVNVGVGGERTDGALARLEKEVILLKPKFVMIMYGTNDSYVDEGKSDSRLTSAEYRKNLDAICERLQQAGIVPILMTEPRWGNAGKNGLGENPNVRLEKFMVECRSVAKSRSVFLIDHFEDWEKAEKEGRKIADWTTDQCHPNPAGHRVMAERMIPVLEMALKKQQD
jgi:lysophospholipase L1-like esterase